MVLRPILTVACIAFVASSFTSAQQRTASSGDLKIVVIAGEGAVNIIQQKTAVAPIIEVRDRNNLPVAGVSVTFSVSGSGASFGTGSTLSVMTNAAGQATAAGLSPTAAGAVQINVSAAFQGQAATAAITQTNFATAAQATAAAGSSGGGGAAGATAGAAGGGGLSATTLVIAGAAVAGGGAVVATKTDLFGGGSGFIMIIGQVFSTVQFGGTCTVAAGQGQAPAECYGPPIGGAVVSTSLDSATATTDGAGNFDLTTTLPSSRIRECMAYTITISATAQPTAVINVRGFAGNEDGPGSHRQKFSLSPVTPSSMGGGC